ncbi:MAG: hypothetical protein ACLPTZ_24015 [Beijerinckiaceae bacterium]
MGGGEFVDREGGEALIDPAILVKTHGARSYLFVHRRTHNNSEIGEIGGTTQVIVELLGGGGFSARARDLLDVGCLGLFCAMAQNSPFRLFSDTPR